MESKLDPGLLEVVENADAGRSDAEAAVDVLVGLTVPVDPDVRRDLRARGLTVRSEIGTVLTGSIRIRNLGILAQSSCVVKIEASTPMHAEGAAFDMEGFAGETM